MNLNLDLLQMGFLVFIGGIPLAEGGHFCQFVILLEALPLFWPSALLTLWSGHLGTQGRACREAQHNSAQMFIRVEQSESKPIAMPQ